MTTLHAIDAPTARNGILRALKRRSLTPARWSVRIKTAKSAPASLLITAAPRYLDTAGNLHPADAAELGRLLALGHPAPAAGVAVPGDGTALREYYERADGRFGR